jgi:hypothetical protein
MSGNRVTFVSSKSFAKKKEKKSFSDAGSERVLLQKL